MPGCLLLLCDIFYRASVDLVCVGSRDIHCIDQGAMGPSIKYINKHPHHEPYGNTDPGARAEELRIIC